MTSEMVNKPKGMLTQEIGFGRSLLPSEKMLFHLDLIQPNTPSYTAHEYPWKTQQKWFAEYQKLNWCINEK